jgi:crotonobetainyl-CoA:carnitine CoA-transferase CaiB-like acyl-CoA transferase
MAVILDLTDHAAVYGPRLLAEAGHEVIRVEASNSDPLRTMRPFSDVELDGVTAADHEFLNAGKRSVAIDLSKAAGRAVLLDLARQADAIIASSGLPIGESDLMESNPRIVLVTTCDDDRPELCAYAHSGLMSITGSPGDEPRLLGGHSIFMATGLYVAIATSAALFAASRTGQGQRVVVSIADAMTSLLEQAMVGYVATGTVTERRGYRGQITAVSGAFPCADGYWMLSLPPTREAWRRFMDWVQDPELAGDESLFDERERLKKRDFILDRLDAWSQRFPKARLVAEAQERHIPASPVATPLELVDDPQLIARGFLARTSLSGAEETIAPVGALASLLETDLGPAPRRGEHTREVLFSLGYSPEEQNALAELGVIDIRRS